MLYISESDIKNSISFNELMDSIEQAYVVYEEKNYKMPDRIHINNSNDTLLYMPCFTNQVFGTKILTVFPNNTEFDEPVIQGLMLLNDINTGKPLCIINGASLTAYRTGAVGGVGIRHTTQKDINSVGLIGTGVQGFYQILFASTVRNVKKVSIFDISKDKLKAFKVKLQKYLPDVKINIADSAVDLLNQSQVVITCTTANEPVLPNEKELLQNKHYIGIGSYKPNMREYPKELFNMLDEMYIDTDYAKEESGDIITPIKEGWIKEEQIRTFGYYIKNKKSAVKNTTLYKSVGMALFDIVVAQQIYNKVKEKGLGQKIEL
ncbi:ornithine cyclodeaminase family protein [Abyssisolibacter fermentans]|uniref:ornithine cyclodeaminase family protein n=1 Tax=Abyssisolibacter fermentans TaxID=1766203 RepID=UPI000831B67E|nr:ornithine cyclodeaminase family protein [Abyssisolibacter fermentans]